MRVMSCNIRTSAAWDEENAWPHRKSLCCRVIRSREPDIICCQEAREDQWRDLLEEFTDYEPFSAPEEPGSQHPMNVILFRRDRFRRIGAGVFWLSETPHVPGLRSWDTGCVRLAPWVILEAETAEEFAVINTHLDHVSQLAREQGARLINQWAGAFPEAYPRILTGDMNAGPDNAVIAEFKAPGWRSASEEAPERDSPGYTCHGFRGFDESVMGESWGQEIDWIFLRGDCEARSYEVVCDSRAGRYPSDHFFLFADVGF